MEAEAAKIPEGSKRPALIGSHDSLCRILDHHQVMPSRNVHDGVHLAAHTCIVYRHNSSGMLRNSVLNQTLVNIHSVRSDIHEYGRRTAQHKCIRRGHECIGRHDHLITRLDFRQQRRQLRRMGARSRKQAPGRTGLPLDPLAALSCKGSVSADLLVLDGLLHILKFFARKRGHVKVDHICNPLYVLLR